MQLQTVERYSYNKTILKNNF